MAELDNIPQKATVEVEVVKIDEDTLNTVKEINQQLNSHIVDFGEIYIRKKDLFSELDRLENLLKQSEQAFESKNAKLKEILDELDDKYPQGRLNLQDGTVTYQPGALSKKQMLKVQQDKLATPPPMPNFENNSK